MEGNKTSDKVKSGLVRKGVKKKWLATTLGISRVTLDYRFKEHNWQAAEITLMKQHGILI